jgi:hypothetical protein
MNRVVVDAWVGGLGMAFFRGLSLQSINIGCAKTLGSSRGLGYPVHGL